MKKNLENAGLLICGTELVKNNAEKGLLVSGELGVKWAVLPVIINYDTDTVRSLIPLAEKYGVGIALENPATHDDITDTFCIYVDAFKSEYVGACYNIGHANLAGSDDFGIKKFDVNKAEALKKVGDRIKVFISEVKSGEMRGPLVTLSRIHPNFVKRLFELEIPEIQDGTIVVKGISREAGSRTKIAVESRDENVDAIGSCIGKNGMRISAILAELGNEKVDIIKYSENLPEYVAEALSPAKVISVEMEDERSCRVTVSPDQLSLAIGKEGQNAKLVAKLTGCKIDIKA